MLLSPCTSSSSHAELVTLLPLLSLHSLAELEKEVSNLRKGLRAVEVVSTSSSLPGLGGAVRESAAQAAPPWI